MLMLRKGMDNSGVSDFLEEILVLIIVIIVFGVSLYNMFGVWGNTRAVDESIDLTHECERISWGLINWEYLTVDGREGDGGGAEGKAGVLYQSKICDLNASKGQREIVLGNFSSNYHYAFKIDMYSVSDEGVVEGSWTFLGPIPDISKTGYVKVAMKKRPVCILVESGAVCEGHPGALSVVMWS